MSNKKTKRGPARRRTKTTAPKVEPWTMGRDLGLTLESEKMLFARAAHCNLREISVVEGFRESWAAGARALGRKESGARYSAEAQSEWERKNELTPDRRFDAYLKREPNFERFCVWYSAKYCVPTEGTTDWKTDLAESWERLHINKALKAEWDVELAAYVGKPGQTKSSPFKKNEALVGRDLGLSPELRSMLMMRTEMHASSGLSCGSKFRDAWIRAAEALGRKENAQTLLAEAQYAWEAEHDMTSEKRYELWARCGAGYQVGESKLYFRRFELWYTQNWEVPTRESVSWKRQIAEAWEQRFLPGHLKDAWAAQSDVEWRALRATSSAPVAAGGERKNEAIEVVDAGLVEKRASEDKAFAEALAAIPLMHQNVRPADRTIAENALLKFAQEADRRAAAAAWLATLKERRSLIEVQKELRFGRWVVAAELCGSRLVEISDLEKKGGGK